MKTFADLKRKLVVGVTVTMTHHWWEQGRSPLVGIPRKITIKQTNALQFEGGSWLFWPKATQINIINDKEFSVQLDPENPKAIMSYRVED